MRIPPSFNKWAKKYLLQTLPKYGYELVRISDRHPSTIGNLIEDNWIICNFCGTISQRIGDDHSEGLSCPTCDAIARERVVYQCILDEISHRSKKVNLFFCQMKELKPLTLLECSPRHNEVRRNLYEQALRKYYASDYDMMAHKADIKLDLTSDEDVKEYEQAFDIIICSHVLEHIPDYRLALENLNRMLKIDGFMILQVPLLEKEYTEVTWDEFHQDNTRVYHRFGFDLVYELDEFFSQVKPVVGLLDFEITSPEIKSQKYQILGNMRDRLIILGKDRLTHYGLGNPDLCDAFIAIK